MTAPFDDLKALIAALPAPHPAARPPLVRLGRLGELAEWLAAWRGPGQASVARPILALYAAAHQGAAGSPDEVRRRLERFAAGEGALSAAARGFGAGIEAFDLAVDRPTPDTALRPAMSERECAATVAFGMEALAKAPDLLIVGEIAAGADRAAAALVAALFGGPAEAWSRPAEADWAARAVARAREDGAQDPLELLRQLGGRETAAMAGAILAARVERVPVLLDGFAAAAAAAVLQALAPDSLQHCRAAQATGHPGHAALLARLGLEPLLDLGLDRSEGLGGLAALGLVRTAAALIDGD